jgi:hypothetical protein
VDSTIGVTSLREADPMVYHESLESIKGKKLQSSTQLRSTMTNDSLFTQAEEGLHGKLNVASKVRRNSPKKG